MDLSDGRLQIYELHPTSLSMLKSIRRGADRTPRTEPALMWEIEHMKVTPLPSQSA